jgi:hypothetical protein
MVDLCPISKNVGDKAQIFVTRAISFQNARKYPIQHDIWAGDCENGALGPEIPLYQKAADASFGKNST